MSRLLLAALAVVCFLVPAYGQQTTVADHLQLAASAPNQAPTPVIGKIKISYPAFTDVNGQFYAAASQVVTIAPDGSFSTALPASDTSTKQGDSAAGGLYYSVTYYAAASGVVVSTDQWFVHASATPLTIADVTMHSSDPVLSFDPKGSAAAVLASSLQKSANLSDLASIATAKQNLQLSTVATTGRFEDLVNAPQLAPVASTGKYSDLTGLPAIPTKTSQLTNDANFLTSLTVAPVAISGAYADLTGKPSLSTVASTGSYNDLSDKPSLSFDASGAAAQVLASSLQKSANLSDLTDVSAARTALGLVPVAHTGAYADLTGKPTLSAVASSGSYLDLSNLPTIPTKTSQLTNDSSFVATSQLATVATTGAYADLSGKPALAAVATSGLYTDLSGRPTISTVGSTGNYSDLLGAPALSTVATSGKYVDLTGKPTLATVATSGLYSDLLNAPTVPTKVSDLPNDAGYVAASSLATVATTGAYADLSGKPALNFDVLGAAAAAQAASLQKTANLSDLTDKAAARTALQLSAVASTGAYADLSGKPTLATVATSGSYGDLLNQPTIPSTTSQLTNDSSFVKTTDLSTVATTGAYADLTGKPTLAAVATSGLYTDLTGRPTISTVGSTGHYSDLIGAPILSTVATSGAYADLSGKPTLSLVATTGQYTDLVGAPTVPTKTSQLTNDAGFVAASSLATVATTGSYADLSNKPALNFDPAGTAAAVQAASLQKSANLSDLASAATARTNLGLSAVSASGSYTDLTNKPAFSAVALSGSYADLLNAPVIPSKTSQLTNDAGFAVASTLSAVATTGSYTDLSNKPAIPTKVSDLTNDAGYVNATTAPVVSVNGLTGAVALTFLTPGNNLSDLTNVTTAQTNLHIAAVGVSGSYADLVNKPTLGTASTHPLSDFVLTAQINQANGVPGLDASAQIAAAQIPSLTLAKISDAGTAAGHAAADFLFTSALGVTVAPLDGSKKLPTANLPDINYNTLVGAPTLATVATSGSYADLLNKPAGLPPVGAASGDLGGTYPGPIVTGLNGTNLANLGVGLLKINNGIPSLASNSDITTALTFTPMNPANNLSELTDQTLARTHLGLGSLATASATSVLADNGTNGIPYRTAPGTTRPATGPDLVSLLGYQPVDPAQLGVTIATLDGTTHKLTGTQLPPVDWSDVINAPTFVKTSDIGTTVAPLVNGVLPIGNLPAYPVATATSQGIASFPTSGALLVSAGAVSVDRSQFDAAGVAAAAQTASLQKSANLSDLADKAAARGNLQLAAVAASGSYADLTNKPTLSPVAASGSYADLLNKPTIPTATSQLTNDANFVAASALSTVATTGQFADLKNIPLIPTKTSQLANDAGFAVASSLSTVATTGAYSDLHGTPALATVATTGSYTDLVNKPTLPTFATVASTGSYTDLINQPVLGTIASHPITDFLSSSLLGANSGVAPLDQFGHVPQVNLAAITAGTLTGAGSAAGLVYYNGVQTSQLTTVGSSTSLHLLPATAIDQGEVSNQRFGFIDSLAHNAQAQIDLISNAIGLVVTGSYNDGGGTSSSVNLNTFQSALANANSQVVNIVVWGDSISKCAVDNCGYGAQDFSAMWPNQLAAYFQGKGYTIHGTGIIPIEASNGANGGSGGTADARWTHPANGSFTRVADNTIGPYQSLYGADAGVYYAADASSSFGLSAMTGDTAHIYCATASDSPNGLTVYIDGSVVGQACNSTSSGYQAHVVSFSAPGGLGSHTLKVTGPASGGRGYLYGAEWTTGSVGIDIHNVARGGALADWFGANPGVEDAFTDQLGSVALYVIALGTNDMGQNNANYQSYMQNLINHAGGSSILMLDVIPDGGNSGTYRSIEQSLAASASAPYVSTSGLGINRPDGTHPDDSGQGTIAGIVEQALTASYSGGTSGGGGSGIGTATGLATKLLHPTLTAPSSTFDLTNDNGPASTGYAMLRLFSNGGNGISMQRASDNFQNSIQFTPNGSAAGDVNWLVGQNEIGDGNWQVGYNDPANGNAYVPMLSLDEQHDVTTVHNLSYYTKSTGTTWTSQGDGAGGFEWGIAGSNNSFTAYLSIDPASTTAATNVRALRMSSLVNPSWSPWEMQFDGTGGLEIGQVVNGSFAGSHLSVSNADGGTVYVQSLQMAGEGNPPSCTSTNEGKFWNQAISGSPDKFQVCRGDGSGGYAWAQFWDGQIPATAIADGSVSNTVFQYLAGATSNIQAQLNGTLKMGNGTAAGIPYYDGSTNVFQSVAASTSQISNALTLTSYLTPSSSSGGYVAVNSELFLPNGSPPSCGSGNRGQVWNQTGSGPDVMVVCQNDGSGSYSWQPFKKGVSNATALSGFAAALANSTNQVVNIVIMGDSITQGTGASSLSTSWENLFATGAQGQYGNHGTGLVPVWRTSANGPALWTTTGTWNTDSFANTQSGFGGVAVAGSGATATFNATQADHFRIYYETNSDTGSGFQVSIDGSVVGTYGAATSGGSAQAVTVAVPGGLGTHTLMITAPSSGNARIYGAEAIVGTTGISVTNLAHGGATSDFFGTNAATENAFVPLIGNINLVIVSIGVNDYGVAPSNPLSTYQTNLQRIATFDKNLSGSPATFILDEDNVNVSNSLGLSQSQYQNIEKLVARINNTGYYSIQDQWGSWATANGNGLMSDAYHPNDAGHLAWAHLVENAIFGMTFSGGGSGGNLMAASDGSTTISGTANNLIHLSSSNTNNTGIEFGNSASSLDYILGSGGTTSGGLFPNEFAFYDPSTSTTGLAVNPSGAMVPSGAAFGFSSSATLPNSSNIDTSINRFATDQISILNPSASSGSNVGTAVGSGFRMWNQSQPTCDSTTRGTLSMLYGSGSADDFVQVCIQKGGSYSWQTVH